MQAVALSIKERYKVVRSKDIYSLMFIIVLTGVAVWVVFAPKDNFLGRDVHTRLGLDLQGGVQVLLEAAQDDVTQEEMRTAAGVIERRVNALGVGETVVQLSGENRIIVELPGVENPDQAVETLRGTGRLEFIDPAGQQLVEGQVVRTSGNPDPIQLDQQQTMTETAGMAIPPASNQIFESITEGKDLDSTSVQPTFSQGGGLGNEPAVSFRFTGDSARQLAQFSTNNVNNPMCIALDNTIISCPIIQSALTSGEGIITTRSIDDRDSIYNQLKYGALPIALRVETKRTVSATLGQDSVDASMVAGLVGLSVVGLFMLLYYRLPGFLAVIALLIYTALSFAIYRLIPITLTLAGIAGFVLSIGLAVDANVLIFARLQEELRRQKPLSIAIEQGFREAWPAIRDSSASTLITSTILYMFGNSFGVSIIKGFALTLFLGIILSLFTAIVVTRTLLQLVVSTQFANNLWFFGLDERDREGQEPSTSHQPAS
jgi:preprotein translocase subunit SecD